MSATKFGRYVIKAELGRGGMATVFHAYDPRFERDVAIKVLPREFLHDPQFRARFEREAKTIALLEHPAIVPVYDFGKEDEQPYIVMRYMSGGSLADRLRQGPLSLIDVAQIFSRLAPALDAAHSKEIIHRDLKPGNVLFDQYGNAYVSDFGIARLKQSGGATLTGTAILGTPAYMSPEQIQGDKEIDGRSDIYALGIMLFQMLTGKTPYHAETPAKVMMMHLLEPVPQIRRVKNDLPDLFDTITECALAKDPDDRYQTAREMAEVIEDAVYSSGFLADADQQADVSTRMLPGTTHVARPPTRPRPQPEVSSGGIQVSARRFPLNILWIVIGLLFALGVVAALVVGGFWLAPKLFSNSTATSQATATVMAVVATETMMPADTFEPTNTDKPTLTVMPSDTPQPTEEPTPTETPSPTDTLVPEVLTIGGADKLALLDGNSNIWVVNVDGSSPIQLTSDGTSKNNLQWSPDGEAVVYISGNCAKMVNIESTRVDDIACFDTASPNQLNTFQISPDGTLVGVTFYNQFFIVPYDLEQLALTRKLSDLTTNAVCETIAPYSSNTGTPMGVKWVQWGNDMQSIALLLLGVQNGVQVDLIDLLDISNCEVGPQRIDEFPATRFTVSNYNSNPRFENFTWDGESLFSFVGGTVRNGGFANIYLYNSQTHKGQNIAPMGFGSCCYRDPSWSPDGRYLAFVFQDVALGASNVTQIYMIQYGTLGTDATYIPLDLPDNFFSNQKDLPMPVLRPAD